MVNVTGLSPSHSWAFSAPCACADLLSISSTPASVMTGEPLLAGLVVDLTEVWTFADELAEISDDNA